MQAIAADIRYRLLWCKMLSILYLILVSCEAIGHGGVLFWGCSVWTGCKCKYILCLIESFFTTSMPLIASPLQELPIP